MIRLNEPFAGFYRNDLQQETCRIIFFILRTAQGRQVVTFSIEVAMAVTNCHQLWGGLKQQTFILT